MRKILKIIILLTNIVFFLFVFLYSSVLLTFSIDAHPLGLLEIAAFMAAPFVILFSIYKRGIVQKNIFIILMIIFSLLSAPVICFFFQKLTWALLS